MFWFLAVTLIGQEPEFCTEAQELGVYGSCGFDSGFDQLNFGGTPSRGTIANVMTALNPLRDDRKTVPAIFPCKVDKFGGKSVDVLLRLPD